MASSARALPLPCRMWRRCSDNAEVAALIRSFLLLDLSMLGARGNLRIDVFHDLMDLFWAFVSVPRGMHGRLEFCRLEGIVPWNILAVPKEPSSRADDDTEVGGSEDDGPEDGDSEDDGLGGSEKMVSVTVLVWIDYHPEGRHGLTWQVLVHVPSWETAPTGHSDHPVTALACMRRAFDRRRDLSVTGFVEMPATRQQWCAFSRHWLFGPPQPKQTTLRNWLRPAPGR